MRKRISFGLLGLLLVLAAVGGYYLLYVRQGSGKSAPPDYAAESTTTPGTIVPASTLQTRAAPAGQKEYASAAYDFSVFYPNDLQITEYDEAGNGHTVTFESADGSQGFQIYVIPYAQSQITESQIMIDTHGTASTTPQEIVLKNGTDALAFWSYDGALGEMREVWFLHGGYLYEVTTYANLDSWLAGIMSSWEFTGSST